MFMVYSNILFPMGDPEFIWVISRWINHGSYWVKRGMVFGGDSVSYFNGRILATS